MVKISSFFLDHNHSGLEWHTGEWIIVLFEWSTPLNLFEALPLSRTPRHRVCNPVKCENLSSYVPNQILLICPYWGLKTTRVWNPPSHRHAQHESSRDSGGWTPGLLLCKHILIEASQWFISISEMPQQPRSINNKTRAAFNWSDSSYMSWI